MEKRYNALRIFGTFFKVLGIIAGVLTILALLATCALAFLGGAAIEQLGREFGQGLDAVGILGSALGGLVVAVGLVIYGGGLAITLYALGEGAYLMIAIEENTRKTAALLERQASNTQPVETQ
jgi:ABC-type Fe3+ transport system permease subunit